MDDSRDAFGHMLLDYVAGIDAFEIVERDDGFIAAASPAMYVAPYRDWPGHQQTALRYATGRILDIGCGAGRHALYLQEQGLDVVGIDVSPLAIEVCKRRGLAHAVVMPVTGFSRRLGTFDTLLMLGNNFGLCGSAVRARWLLQRFYATTSEKGRLIAESTDPYQTTDPVHLDYHERNRRRNRMPGQLRLRVRYRNEATPWFDYLLVSQDEMQTLLQGTGWSVACFINSDGAGYIAVIERTPRYRHTVA
jgi:SAM-dependent methyltransferase